MSVHVLPVAREGRKLQSWIAGFLELTEQIWSTEPFRLWAAIMTIAGALERKVWIRSQGANIYPNLYVFLVGPPGAGKTRAVEVCADLWHALPDHKLAPVSLTKASLMDELGAANRIEHQLDPSSFNSLMIASKELGALIPNYDSDFLNALTYLYDCIKYDEKRRGNKDPLIIDRPQINLIGCTTPSFLLDTMPASAWDQGFLSRVILVYKDIIGERKLNLEEEETPTNPTLARALEHDLLTIGSLVGKMKFTAEAARHLSDWADDTKTRPGHPRLQNYVTRRPIHAIKLSIIAAADRSNDLLITREDVTAAIDWLLTAEMEMPNLFMAMKTGGDSSVISEAHHYCWTMFVRSQGAIPTHLLYEFLQTRLPAYRVQAVVDVMLRSGMIKTETVAGVGMITPKPGIY